MKVHDVKQGTVEWHKLRLGIPTASEFKSVMAKGKKTKGVDELPYGVARHTYMMKVLAERFTCEPAEDFTNQHMERGHVLEPKARNFYAFQAGVDPATIQQVGFVTDHGAGCSPDSLIGKPGMLELKTKLPHLQMELLVADAVPSKHKEQLQGQLWLCEREWVDFVSFWPGLPLFVQRVERDEEIIGQLEIDVAAFLETMAEHEGVIRARYNRGKEEA